MDHPSRPILRRVGLEINEERSTPSNTKGQREKKRDKKKKYENPRGMYGVGVQVIKLAARSFLKYIHPKDRIAFNVSQARSVLIIYRILLLQAFDKNDFNQFFFYLFFFLIFFSFFSSSFLIPLFFSSSFFPFFLRYTNLS